MVLHDLVAAFLLETEDLLPQIEQSTLALRIGDANEETINQLFRGFHTIKGSGGMCGLDKVAGFTHHLENLLAKVREGVVAITPQLIDLVLKATDHIKTLLQVEKGGTPPAHEVEIQLVAGIEECAKSGSSNQSPVALVDQAGEGVAGGERTWRIRFKPDAKLLALGSRPLSLLNELRGLGHCTITADVSAVPTLDAIEPEDCYLEWAITLVSACSQNSIRDVFIFVEAGSTVEIELLEDAPAQPLERARTTVAPANAPAPVSAQAKDSARESSVRVPSSRLDRLVNLVGELVINQSRLAQAALQNGTPELTNPVQELERLLSELRDNVLGIRMLPIGTLFGRFQRLVYSLASELGKEADLVTEGAETEMDKSILDQLGEPLVHCLRNSLDHGVEPPEERLACNKPRRATIRLSAVHTGADVVVSIEDDGYGINRARVRAKAIEKQLVSADAVLSDKDIFNLILAPGFSTAQQITNVSGRGVGMDAVKRQIDALRGSLTIASQEGKGTRIGITLPLTLAIIDGLLVEIGADQFIVPMAAVTENVELPRAHRDRNNGRNVIAVRGELIPYIDLRGAFGIPGELPAISKVVIVQKEDQRVGLVVDCVLGTHQTVIQSLGKAYRSVDVVSGATIMGDGRVALILDIGAAVRHADLESVREREDNWRGTNTLQSMQRAIKKNEGVRVIH